MNPKPKPFIANEKAIRGLLEKYACPVPWWEVRTRFLGNISTPTLTISPLRVVQELWGGELPADLGTRNKLRRLSNSS